MRTLAWFRSDLRARDNPMLAGACREANDGVVAVFIISPAQWREHDMAPAKADFILRNLRELKGTLADRRIPLRVLTVDRFEGVTKALLKLADECECGALYFNREYELNERRRDEAVEDTFRERGLAVHAFDDQVIFEPGSVRTGEGKFYEVFSPFRRAWLAKADGDRDRALHVLQLPPKQRPIDFESDAIPESVAGFDGHTRPDLWKAGEEHAASRLRAFIEDRLGDYKAQRDLPALNGTSTLSPYLNAGVLSMRQCLAAAVSANDGRFSGGSTGAETWISELVWREFYRHILVGYPRVSMHRPFDLQTERIRWDDDDDLFNAWAEGRTGYPIVDAAMRQLLQTGWMHNRLRMIVAMFLTKNLFLDWRRGEAFFMRHLVDGDLASNNGGWQWSASTGTDAAPYFRVFNPVSQSERCDPEGAFIRRFLPELERVPARHIHFPADCPDDLFGSLDYPAPIVDHKETRRRAIERFKALKR